LSAQLESKQATHRRRAAQQKALKQGCDDIYDAAYQGLCCRDIPPVPCLGLTLRWWWWWWNAGNVKMLEAFIKSGASVNGYDEEGWTPLMNAALHGHLECVNLLLSAGADPHLVDDQKQTCLHKAAYHAGKSAIVEALLAKGSSSSWRKWSALPNRLLAPTCPRVPGECAGVVRLHGPALRRHLLRRRNLPGDHCPQRQRQSCRQHRCGVERSYWDIT